MDIAEMKFAKVFPMLVQKAERKGRTREDVYEVTRWLTGYSSLQLDEMLQSETTYGEFINNAPEFNPNACLIKGTVCGVRVENIEDSFMKKVRYLDKLVDELAKGKALDKIMRKK